MYFPHQSCFMFPGATQLGSKVLELNIFKQLK